MFDKRTRLIKNYRRVVGNVPITKGGNTSMPRSRTGQEIARLTPKFQEEALSDLLLAAREQSGLTQSEVAEQLNYHRGHFSKLERGEVELKYFDAVLLAGVYGLNIADMTRQLGLPVVGGVGATDPDAIADARLAAAVRLLQGSKDAAWRNQTIDRLYASVLAHEAGTAEDDEPDDPGRFRTGKVPPKRGR